MAQAVRPSSEIMRMIAVSTVPPILCIFSAAVTTASDVKSLRDVTSQTCNLDDLAIEERGSSLLQLEFELRSDRKHIDLPMGPRVLLAETGHLVSEGSDLVGSQQRSSIQQSHVQDSEGLSTAPFSPRISALGVLYRISYLFLDSAALLQDNNRTSKQVNHTKAFKHVHLLGMAQRIGTHLFSRRLDMSDMSQGPAVMLWILLLITLVVCLILCLLLGASDTTQAAKKHLDPSTAPAPHLDANIAPAPQLSRISAFLRHIMPVDDYLADGRLRGADSRMNNPQFLDATFEEVVAALPCISPLLLLPFESFYRVPMQQMRPKGNAAVNIITTNSGISLLIATVDEKSDGRRCLSIAACGAENYPEIQVFASKSPSISRSTLSGSKYQIYTKFGQPFGILSHGAGGGMLLKLQNGQVILSLQTASDDFSMTAYSKGHVLASSGINMTLDSGHTVSEFSGPTWNLKVKPGVDPLLILACMLGFLCMALNGSDDPTSSV